MNRLYVLYDPTCGLCVECRAWMETQPQIVPLTFVPSPSPEAARIWPGAAGPGPPEELVVVGDTGAVYRGTEAYILCLYALADWREWSFRLAGPAWKPVARRFFHWLARHRGSLSAALGRRGEAAPEGGAGAPLTPHPLDLHAPSSVRVPAHTRTPHAEPTDPHRPPSHPGASTSAPRRPASQPDPPTSDPGPPTSAPREPSPPRFGAPTSVPQPRRSQPRAPSPRTGRARVRIRRTPIRS